MENRRILIVSDKDELRNMLEASLRELGHEVLSTASRADALARADFNRFDLVISDLTDDAEADSVIDSPESSGETPQQRGSVKSFKIDFGTKSFLRAPYRSDDLRAIIEQTLAYELRFTEDLRTLPHAREKIEFELPSDVALMHGVLQYLIERVSRLGVIQAENSNLFVALDEAFVNAVKHGNRYDHTKFVRISAELSADEARFTVEDEGEGFNVADVPDPCDAENLFKTSGRGVLLIYNIMDEVQYNARGNRLTMVKRSNEGLLHTKIIDSPAPPKIKQPAD
jgi:serine/threonine-protein kinase RsbW